MGLELRVMLVAIVGVVLLWFGIGAILPSSWTVETTAELRAPLAEVQPLLGDFGKWREWTALGTTERANTAVAVEGAPGQPGHQIAWRAAANEAVLRLTAAGPTGIEYDFLTRVGEGTELRPQGHGSIQVTTTTAGTKLVWRDQSRTDSMAERWFAWFGAQQDAARKFQESSVGSLRNKLEAKAPAAK